MARTPFLIAVFVCCVLVAGLVAQTRRDPTAVTASSEVISGENIGFRATGPADQTGRVPGVFVVKINGLWVEAAPASK